MRRAFLLGLCLLVLTACDSGQSGDSGFDPDASISIADFTVTGTSAPRNGAVQISTQENQGRFTIDFSLSEDNSLYTARVAVSDDQTFDDDLGDRVIAGSCGKASLVDDCQRSVTVDCTYSRDNTNLIMTCINAINLPQESGLTGFFGDRSYPANAYLVLQVCNAFVSSCDTRSVLALFN